MSQLTIAGVLILLPTILALQCHQVSTPLRLTDPITSQAMECGFNALSCVKVVDMTNGQYTKACQYTNCTSPTGTTNQPAQCFNTSGQTGRETYNCCCYGNGCNAAPQNTVLGALAGTLVLFGASKFFF